MERQTKVLDASVLVKWFSEEKYSEKAIELRDKHIRKEIIIAVSQITFVEVLNALRYKKKNKDELKKAGADLWNMQLRILKTNERTLERAVEFSLEHNLTLYDSLYLAIADIHNISLITADSSLINLKNTIALENT